MNMDRLPRVIESGEWTATGHVQGIAVCPEKNFICYSFTTVLVKTDLAGNLIGTVGGLVGHLGCIDYNAEDGRVFGSLEYKNDAIGKGIMKTLGREGEALGENAFYVVAFDVDKIDRVGLDAERDGIMTAVYLPDVVADFEGKGENGADHRYACSGIDGTAIGPVFGAPKDSPTMLMIAYGVYGDVTRRDNDHQVILQYDWRRFKEYEQPLLQGAPHHSGPTADARYFLYTGNTTYGVQNLCYDPATNYYFAAVYHGKKEHFPNYDMFVIDASVAPKEATLAGLDEQGMMLSLAPVGAHHAPSGTCGFHFPWGATGMHALGNGCFYISQERSTKTPPRVYASTVRLYHYTGDAKMPFVEVPFAK